MSEAAQPSPGQGPAAGPVRVAVQVRFSDVDVFGHVNNAAYLRYLEDARFASFEAAGLCADGTVLPRVLVMARQEIEYLRPLLPRCGFVAGPAGISGVAVDTWVLRVGRSSVDLGHEVLDPAAGVVYARSRSRMVCVDRATGQPQPLDGEHRAQLLRHLGEDVPLRPWE
ncbi:acyl-CoA thioester hydrolase [Kineococcus xinjiangensis]|uniref:Acyl-CoA thioester hydrolase n=1 Tax=Kineococcus xinjiangensis TaxID=512762 RepID=A0A2S6ID22_9ACTN|nr:thioesterase family protein [Kineococcus xinjiangensis]PPK92115.1 acyl-CoA thioester hydrolase [Kineococcus xinjiangensis]